MGWKCPRLPTLLHWHLVWPSNGRWIFQAVLRCRDDPIAAGSAFKEPPYVLTAISNFMRFWGLYFSLFYVGSYVKDIIGLSESNSIYLLMIMNGGRTPMRLLPNWVADRYVGPVNAMAPFLLIAGVLLYCWATVTTTPGLYIFAALYGLFAAGFQSLFPAALTRVTTDLSKEGVRMGMTFTLVSFAILTGTPLAGALIQRDHGRYLYGQMSAGSLLTLSLLLILAARTSITGWKLRVKV